MKPMIHAHAAPARRGNALALALIVVMLVASMGVVFLRISVAVTSRQTAEVETMKAFYLAEAGLAEAFQAVRVGRTGQLGSEAEPAVHGDGILWVDATETVDTQVRLESTALVGAGRASLALVVEPVEVPLGFFSDEDLVIDAVLLTDGFDSGAATYEEQLGGLIELQAYADAMQARSGREKFERLLERNQGVPGWFESAADLSEAEERELESRMPDLVAGYTAETLSTDGGPSAVHTDSGGLLASNGSVTFDVVDGGGVEVYGDVIPGPNSEVVSLTSLTVTGSTDPRTRPVELPAVEVPAVTMAAAVRHEGLLPLLISSGTSGHQRIEVAAGAELVLRGPATIVIGTLVLEPGALLTLDTRDGDVSLYVTGGLDLQAGSLVTTSSDMPDETTIQVDAIPTGPDGAPVKLDATSQFHGTIYAPETEVRIGSDFEVYGSVVARRLEIGAGARLHFDNSGIVGTQIPRIVAWKIVQIPNTVRGGRNPYELLGIERGTLAPLSDSHDLTWVMLSIEYRNQSGGTSMYYGPEDIFNWDQVAEIVTIERDPTRIQEEPTEVDEPGEQPDLRPGVLDAIASMSGSALESRLIGMSPLSDAELGATIDTSGLGSSSKKTILDTQVGLSDLTLTRVLTGTAGGLSESDRRAILLDNSPLSPEIVAYVTNAPATILSTSGRAAVLAAQ